MITAIRMRSLLASAIAPLLCLSACSSEPTPGPAPTSSAIAPAPDASPPSPFSVVVEAKGPIAFSGLSGGVAASDHQKTRWAFATEGADLKGAPMPPGLPEGDARITRFAGKAPGSIWLNLEIPGEDKKSFKHPLYRLDTKKNEWKRFVEDWRPLLAGWSKGRILSASTSSGKLKVKVMEPYSAKPPEDAPSPRVDDEVCQKGLKVEALAPLPSGEVFMAGNCKRRYVLVQWAQATDTPAASASGKASAAPSASSKASAAASVKAAPSSSAVASGSAAASGSAIASSSAAPSASAAASGSAAPSGSAVVSSSAIAASSAAPSNSAAVSAAGSADPDDAASAVEEPQGPPGKVFAMPGIDANLAHRSLSARSESDVWLLGEEEKTRKSHLYHFDGTKLEEVTLPALEAPAKAASIGAGGVLWLVTEQSIWQRAADGSWQSIPPPNAAYPEAEARWEMFDVWAVGQNDVWVSAKHASKSNERYVLLRLLPAKELLKWQ